VGIFKVQALTAQVPVIKPAQRNATQNSTNTQSKTLNRQNKNNMAGKKQYK